MNKLREEIAMYTDTPRHVDNILALIKEAIGEPPLLRDGAMLKAMQKAYEFTRIVMTDIDKGVRAVTKAQRDADVRYYEKLFN